MVNNVIVADDTQAWREEYVLAVKAVCPDANIDQVETGADLTERVLQGDYSLVISDNDMEGEDDGLTALDAVRASGNNVPFYMVSGGSTRLAIDALRAGANEFYDKGEFDSDKLEADIAKHL